jgi:hypothetical protein
VPGERNNLARNIVAAERTSFCPLGGNNLARNIVAAERTSFFPAGGG